MSRYQWLLLLLLALLLVTDGYDAQVLGYVVPTLAQEWGLDKAAFGPVFSANLFGLTVGSLLVTRWRTASASAGCCSAAC
ncbi:putative MFS transporter [Pseudomonas aeruginosa]|nr:putative MFS transporter [Pseudomonas aeruginosa]